MPIVRQRGEPLRTQNTLGENLRTVTIQVANRDIFAEIALYSSEVFDAPLYAYRVAKCGIVQIVSDSGVEDWDIKRTDTHKPVAFRSNVTSITFGVFAIDARASARWMLYYWS